MNFDLPWRIHWTLTDGVTERVVEAVRSSGPLALTLEVEEPAQLEALALPWQGTAVAVIFRGWAGHSGRVENSPATRWEFPVRGPEEAAELVGRSFFGLPPEVVSLRWFPFRNRMRDLDPLLEIVRASGCGITLPNRPAGVINSHGAQAFPAAEEVTSGAPSPLREAAAGIPPDRLRVHDYILTRVLGLGGVEPAGCEAANSLAYIDGKGIVYPCETLMVPMGDLNRDDFLTIWTSALRDRIRRDVSSVPGLCGRCPELAQCRAGCRGAVYHLMGHYGAPDPLCPETGDHHD